MLNFLRRWLRWSPLNCCCPEPPPISTSCCPSPVPASLTITDGTNTYTLSYSGGQWGISDVNFIGCEHADITLTCNLGVWQLQVSANSGAGGSFPTKTCGPTGSCDPFDMSCSMTGCDGGTYTVDITE